MVTNNKIILDNTNIDWRSVAEKIRKIEAEKRRISYDDVPEQDLAERYNVSRTTWRKIAMGGHQPNFSLCMAMLRTIGIGLTQTGKPLGMPPAPVLLRDSAPSLRYVFGGKINEPGERGEVVVFEEGCEAPPCGLPIPDEIMDMTTGDIATWQVCTREYSPLFMQDDFVITRALLDTRSISDGWMILVKIDGHVFFRRWQWKSEGKRAFMLLPITHKGAIITGDARSVEVLGVVLGDARCHMEKSA